MRRFPTRPLPLTAERPTGVPSSLPLVHSSSITSTCKAGRRTEQQLPLLRRSVRPSSSCLTRSDCVGLAEFEARMSDAGGKSGDDGGDTVQDDRGTGCEVSEAAVVDISGKRGVATADAEDDDVQAKGCGDLAIKCQVSVGRGRARRGVLRGVDGGVDAAIRSERQTGGSGMLSC